MPETETIAAVATPPGRGGIGVVRISGPMVSAIAAAVCSSAPVAGRAGKRRFVAEDGSVIDEGVALYFSKPRSYTGEDVLELQGHGGRVVLNMLLERVLSLGARRARPGEFTERAFLNDKIDLAQAEAVADLIDSQTEAAARSAQRSLQGEFSACIDTLMEALVEARVWTESAIDFPEEEIDFLSDGQLAERLCKLEANVQATLDAAVAGALLREGVNVVISGPPNAGKSSLLNLLARRERAIVTDLPGTTRDLVQEHIAVDGLPVNLIDTAGLRDTADPVERMGIERARTAIAEADIVIEMFDDTLSRKPEHTVVGGECRVPVVRVFNKVDLSGGHVGSRARFAGGAEIGLSATTGAGVEALLQEIGRLAGMPGAGENVFVARQRHLQALRCGAAHVEAARERLRAAAGGELVAEELRLAQRALGEITGAFSTDDLLERIFADFCIGK